MAKKKKPKPQQFNLLQLGEPESSGAIIPAPAPDDDNAMTPDSDNIAPELAIITEINNDVLHSDPSNNVINDEGTDAGNIEAPTELNNDSDAVITDANEIINAPYGYCHCGMPILIPGLGASKCSHCGWRGGY